MRDLEGVKASGSFYVDGRWIAGELDCQGADTSIHLHDGAYFQPNASGDGVVKGILADRTSVTLVGCLLHPICGSGQNSGRGYYFSDAFVHHVIVGAYVDPAKAYITRIHVETDDGHRVFDDFDAFGSAFSEEAMALAARLIEAQARSNGRPVVVGEYPEVSYFTGKTEIIRFDTVLGQFSADHRSSPTLESAGGSQRRKSVVISLAPPVPTTFERAIDDITILLRFVALVAGRKQNIVRLYVETAGEKDDAAAVGPLMVRWSTKPVRAHEREGNPRSRDLPLDPIRKPDEFTAVMTNWLARDETWRIARARFDDAWSQGRSYSADRLIAAANMFDLLPDSAAPKKAPLSPALKTAKGAIRAILQALPESLERRSMLDALGRWGTATLKHKVRHRMTFVPQELRDRFPDLEIVLMAAVDCRNYFVHGGKAKLDYDEGSTMMVLTDALEFTFAASDLGQAGWCPDWEGRGFSWSHPFVQFRETYDVELTELRACISERAKKSIDSNQ